MENRAAVCIYLFPAIVAAGCSQSRVSGEGVLKQPDPSGGVRYEIELAPKPPAGPEGTTSWTIDQVPTDDYFILLVLPEGSRATARVARGATFIEYSFKDHGAQVGQSLHECGPIPLSGGPYKVTLKSLPVGFSDRVVLRSRASRWAI